MKLISWIIILLLSLTLLFIYFNKTENLGGEISKVHTFSGTATSGVMSITSSAQILATSTRAYAIICNDSSQVVYLRADSDKSASDDNGIRLNANGGCYEIDGNNSYVGAITASSTNETASRLLINEYK